MSWPEECLVLHKRYRHAGQARRPRAGLGTGPTGNTHTHTHVSRLGAHRHPTSIRATACSHRTRVERVYFLKMAAWWRAAGQGQEQRGACGRRRSVLLVRDDIETLRAGWSCMRGNCFLILMCTLKYQASSSRRPSGLCLTQLTGTGTGGIVLSELHFSTRSKHPSEVPHIDPTTASA